MKTSIVSLPQLENLFWLFYSPPTPSIPTRTPHSGGATLELFLGVKYKMPDEGDGTGHSVIVRRYITVT